MKEKKNFTTGIALLIFVDVLCGFPKDTELSAPNGKTTPRTFSRPVRASEGAQPSSNVDFSLCKLRGRVQAGTKQQELVKPRKRKVKQLHKVNTNEIVRNVYQYDATNSICRRLVNICFMIFVDYSSIRLSTPYRGFLVLCWLIQNLVLRMKRI